MVINLTSHSDMSFKYVARDWRNVIIVGRLLYFSGIHLLSVAQNVYVKVLHERMIEIADGYVGNEQGVFTKGRT